MLKKSINILIDITLLVIIFFNCLWVFRNDGLRDFGSFIASGQAANSGENPYKGNNPLTFTVTFEPLNLKVPSYNLNPPISVVFFQYLAKINPLISYRLWQGFSLLCYISLVIIYGIHTQIKLSFQKILWAFSFAGLWHTIELGQIYLPFALLFGIALIFLENQKFDWVSGILLGICIAIKPNFLLIIVFLLLLKKLRASLFAVASAAMISVIPIFIYGIDIYHQWRIAVSAYNGYAIPGNNSILGLLIRIGLEDLNPVFILLLIILGLILVWKYRYDIFSTGIISLIITLLISPVAWPGYTTFLLPYFLKYKWNILSSISAAILSVPVLVIFDNYYYSQFHLVFLGWLYGWSLLLLFISITIKGKSKGLVDEKAH